MTNNINFKLISNKNNFFIKSNFKFKVKFKTVVIIKK